MRGRGLLAGMILGVLVVSGWAQAQQVSVFDRDQQTLDRKYGVQLNGGGATYLMSDVNDFRASQEHLSNQNDANFGIGWGFALLYRSHKNFRWTVGYNRLGQDKAEGQWYNTEGTLQVNEMDVVGNEYYFMGNYLIRFGEGFHLYLAAGPALYSGRLDRRSSAVPSIYDAKGRGFGVRAEGGAEFLLSKNIGITAAAGFRMAKIKEVSYKDRNNNVTTLYWGSSNRELTLDFSGIFFQGGLRVYFDPATHWFRM